jgi:hypothetical protein
MTAYVEQLLSEFVNRDEEMARFGAMIEHDHLFVTAICGEGGIGKSSLIDKMFHEAAQRELPRARLEWTEARSHDYLAVMRTIRDHLGTVPFRQFTDHVNFFTVPQYKLTVSVEGAGSIAVLDQGKVVDARVGDIAGVIVKDLMLTLPRHDMDVPESERRSRLTDAFVPGLAAATAERPCVIFLDAVEKMTPETAVWFWQDLLPRLRDQGATRAKFVLCGRSMPPMDRTWRRTAEYLQLKPLAKRHIVEYLVKRGVETAAGELAEMLLIATSGNMFHLATWVDAYLERVRGKADG